MKKEGVKMPTLKKICFVVIVLTAYLFCPFIAGKDVLLAEELREEKEFREGKLGFGRVPIKGGRLKEGRLKVEKPIPAVKELILIAPAPKPIELKPIRLIPIREIKQIEFETTGYNGEPIIFSSRNIFRLIKLEEDLYSIGDYVTSQGMLRYDGQTKLNYIDIIKIDREGLSANTYIALYFKEPPSISERRYYEITGVVGEVFSKDRIYLDEVVDLREISIDRDRIIETCSSSIRDSLNIIISAPVDNEKLRSWMSKEYGMSGLSENQVLQALDNVERIGIDYDFFDQIAACSFYGKAVDTSKDFYVEIRLKCLYNSDSESVEKIDISFGKVKIGRIN